MPLQQLEISCLRYSQCGIGFIQNASSDVNTGLHAETAKTHWLTMPAPFITVTSSYRGHGCYLVPQTTYFAVYVVSTVSFIAGTHIRQSSP